MSGVQDLTRDVDIDLSGLMRELRRKIWLIIGLPLLTAAALFFIFSSMEPSYRSSARVIIEKRESVFTRRTDADSALASNQFDQQAIGSQVEILSSDDLALKVIAKLDLVNNPEFASEEPSIMDALLAVAGIADAGLEVSPEERALIEFRKRRSVFAIENSRVISIEFWAHDRDLAQEIPNAIADAFLALTKASKLESTEAATEWLGPEIEELRAKVRDAEAKVADFRASSDILVGSNNALLATQQLSEISTELSRIKGERSAAEGKISAIRAALEVGGSLEVIPEVIESQLIQRLREQEVALQAQISELSTTLLPNHPRIKALRSQSADFSGQIRNAAANILKSLENNVDLLRKQEAVLTQEVNRLKAEAGRVGEAEVGLRALEREANAQRELLESYLTQYREAASRTNRDYLPVDARIISRAVRPSDSFYPKVIPFTVAGAAMSMVLAVVGVLGAALLGGRAFKVVGQVEPGHFPERVEIPVGAQGAGAIVDAPLHQPENKAGTGSTAPVTPVRRPAKPADLPIADAPSLQPTGPDYGPDARELASFAANDPEVFSLGETAKAITGLGKARIAAISPAGDEGSVVCQELARLLAGSGKAVALVDLTGSGTTTEHFLGTSERVGIAELLAGSVNLEQAIAREERSGITILPVGRSSEPGAEAMDRLSKVADELGKGHDFVIFDCGYAGADGLKTIADNDTIVVVSVEGATRHEVRAIEAELIAAGFSDAVAVRLLGSGTAQKGRHVAA